MQQDSAPDPQLMSKAATCVVVARYKRVDNRKRDEEDMKNLELIMLREADAGKWLWRTEDVDSWVYRKMFGWNVR